MKKLYNAGKLITLLFALVCTFEGELVWFCWAIIAHLTIEWFQEL